MNSVDIVDMPSEITSDVVCTARAWGSLSEVDIMSMNRLWKVNRPLQDELRGGYVLRIKLKVPLPGGWGPC